MDLLKTIQLNKKLTPVEIEGFKLRKAVRVVVFDSDMNIGILYVANHDYHKLPGGGIEEGEDIMEALDRECLEEIGCSVKVCGEVGKTIEYRDEWMQTQSSYCYIARVEGEKGAPSFTELEESGGFTVKW